jgi:hypothetical protein
MADPVGGQCMSYIVYILFILSVSQFDERTSHDGQSIVPECPATDGSLVKIPTGATTRMQ